MQIDRRLFLFSAALPLYPAAPLQVFSAEEAKIVEAICDRIIPADDMPGAKQAGVLYYIDRKLAGPLKRFAPAYREGIADFAKLSPVEQTAFLHNIEAGKMPGLASFFQMVVDQTMQGFYGSPEHGGNRDEASWKMLDIVPMMKGHH